MPPRVDITGQKFNRLVAIKRVAGRVWLWKCDCGTQIERESAQVKNGNTKSCGCLKIEAVVARNTTHGLARHPLYTLWCGMHARCSNPKHEGFGSYGARGIKVCERWNDFANFISDMGPRPAGMTLDRLDTDGDYEPSNCTWSTRREQSENTRRNQFLELKGRRQTVSQWARELGVDQRTLNRRRYLGWSDERVLTTPIGG